MGKTKKNSKLSLSTWIVIWIAGLAGQLVWCIENQWFNTFVYDKIAPDPSIITWMVAISAIVSTFATFLMGTISDRIGKRRIFILMGYILWGVSTICFGLTQFTIGALGVTGTIILVVLADAVMSFFGSMGNDCGFSSWTTDISSPSNRGTIGTVLAVQPVIATVSGSLVFGAILSAFTTIEINGQKLDYVMLFLLVGIAIIIVGVISFLLSKEGKDVIARRDETFIESVKKPFNFKVLKNNKVLLYVLLTFCVFFISFNIYFPHMLNYFIYGGASYTVEWLSTIIFGSSDSIEMVAGALLAIGLVLAFPVVIFCAKFLNKLRFIEILFLSIAANIIGLAILFFGGLSGVQEIPLIFIIIIGIFFVGVGYMCLYQCLMAWIKNLYPSNMRSQFEGIRMIFYVCIPMFLGTLIGNIIVSYLGDLIIIDYARGPVEGYAPNHWLFLIAICVALCTYIPVILLAKEIKNNPPIYEGLEEEKEINATC